MCDCSSNLCSSEGHSFYHTHIHIRNKAGYLNGKCRWFIRAITVKGLGFTSFLRRKRPMRRRTIRNLTPKAMEEFTQHLANFNKRINREYEIIYEIVRSPTDNENFEEKELLLHRKCATLDSVYLEFRDFLTRQQTLEANNALEILSNDYEKIIYDVTLFKDKLKQLGQTKHSTYSKARSNSSTSSKARAAAAKEKLKLLEVEFELRRKKAEIEEKQAIEAAIVARRKENLELEIELVKQRRLTGEAEADVESDNLSDFSEKHSVKTKYLKPTSESNEHQDFDKFTKFLLRKDLTLSRLSCFDDKPENYDVWKNSFKSVCQEIGVCPSEEIDLLIKWLGPESKKYGVTIRASNSHDLNGALKKLWNRLEERFGSVEGIHRHILQKLESVSKIWPKDCHKLYDLYDVLSEVESLKSNPKFNIALSYFDSSVGISPIVAKLPYYLQERWITVASNYKEKNSETFPPLSEFVNFVRKQAKVRNDPSLMLQPDNTKNYSQDSRTKSTRHTNQVSSNKIAVNYGVSDNIPPKSNETPCPIHNSNTHTLESCRTFKLKDYDNRRQFVKEQKLCFKCFNTNHLSKDCLNQVTCQTCGRRHNTLMHIESFQNYGGEKARQPWPNVDAKPYPGPKVSSSCIDVCGTTEFPGKSCSKICLVKVKDESSTRSMLCYAIVDEQSNRSLAKPVVFETLRLPAQETEYTIISCGGQRQSLGRVANCSIESIDGQHAFDLKSVLECKDIPNSRNEIPTPEIAMAHQHLADIANEIPRLNAAEICLLIGRDAIDVHHVLDQKFGPRGSPYAQKLPLGWVVVGEVCIGTHTEHVTVTKTYLLNNGRPTLFQPCPSQRTILDIEPDPLFKRTKDDESPSLSIHEKEFLEIMEKNIRKEDEKWSAPLPFNKARQNLENNYDYAMTRARSFKANLDKNPIKKSQVFEFMGKLIEKGHAEEAPEAPKGRELWYLPVFAVYHPRKPDNVRCVFDSSAVYKGTSLNQTLLPGPDLINSLLGILMRFRRMPIAVVADIQQMFYSFRVHKEHRDYLRFLWHKDNDADKPLIQYRMTVHVFGNSPSPSIATYCLHKTVETADEDVKTFVQENFYVDDALTSLSNHEEAVSLMKRTQESLAKSGIVLHKVASNSPEVVLAFSSEQLAKELVDINIGHDEMPTQRSLGLLWDLNNDTFRFEVAPNTKPFTRRGVLSVVNSLFDPLGFLAPISIQGKIILRKLTIHTISWDDPLPQERLAEWTAWKESLSHLKKVSLPRCYFHDVPINETTQVALLVFCDASELAIAAVAYIRSLPSDQLSFVFGKAKVAPTSGHTIPRLELCAAVLATQIASTVQTELKARIETINYYTDSKIVLGYIHNSSRRFAKYVSNRVEMIRRESLPEQWQYVSTQSNPADIGTRGIQVEKLRQSMWITGPPTSVTTKADAKQPPNYPLINPEEDKEVKKEVKTLKNTAEVRNTHLRSERFSRFSSWKRLVSAIALLTMKASQLKGNKVCTAKVDRLEQAERLILYESQLDSYQEEYTRLTKGKPLPKDSKIANLNPYIDNQGLMRVGGRINATTSVTSKQKNPVIVSGKHHIALLICRHYHGEVSHQGRHFTEGAVRAEGFWVTGSKRLVSTLIHKCIQCRKLRGKFEGQKMADLPSDRIEEAPPFTYVGVDMFGPWDIVTRRTRGGQANSKRWAILFTCLCVRAIHIEIVEDMSSSSFLNALRRFVSIRGKVKQYRSDRGTNFVGATEDANIQAINIEDRSVQMFLQDSRTTWLFNAPHSSHMGGAWERMIGITRRILENMLLKVNNLTHEVLVTLMAEVAAIVNSRPLLPISYDSEYPEILTPATLLTQKIGSDVQPLNPIVKKDLYKSQWQRVQHLADVFWKRWKNEYLPMLQPRQKWHRESKNLKIGDIVLVRDYETGRMNWPMACITKTFESDDGLVRKVEVCLVKDGKRVFYTRPVVEVIMLISEDC